jgi:hypothetical protein
MTAKGGTGGSAVDYITILIFVLVVLAIVGAVWLHFGR